MVILFAALVPGVTGNSLALNGHSVTAYSLDFSSFRAGSYPSNLSWINFHNINANQYSKFSVEPSKFGNGLLESTHDYSNVGNAFLDIGMSLFQNYTLKITFAWSPNNSYSGTGNNIFFENGSVSLLHYKFGEGYNKSLYLEGRKTVELGPEPPPFDLYTLQISGSEPDGTIYTGIAPGFNQSSHTPFLFNDSFHNAPSNCNFLFGGAFSNITIYNIYFSNNISGFNTVNQGQSIGYRETNISSVYFKGFNPDLQAKPLVDWLDNSILYATKANGSEIYSYNFYNNTMKALSTLQTSQELFTTAGTASNGYFLTGNSTGTTIDVYNYTTGVFTAYQIDRAPESGLTVFPAGNAIYVQYGNGSLYVYNKDAREVRGNISFQASYIPLQSWIEGSSLITEIYDNNTGNFSAYEIGPDGELTDLSTMNLGEVDFRPTFFHQASSGLVSSSVLSIGNYLHSSYSLAGDSYVPYAIESNFTVKDSSGSRFMLENNSGVYLQDQGCMNLTNVNMNFQFLSFNSNFTRGVSINNRTITLYTTSNQEFSPDNISLIISVPGIIRGNVSLHYSITSKVNYTVNATLGNISIETTGEYANFSTSGFESGSYMFKISATNIAGYSSAYEKQVSVDNYRPEILSSPGNGTLLLSGSTIKFTVTNISGNFYTTVEEPGGHYLNFSGNGFNVTDHVNSGPFNISLSVTDQFGLQHNFTFMFATEEVNYSEYHTNIRPGSYLPSGNLNLSWTNTSFASGYNLTVMSKSQDLALQTISNYTHLKLGPGYFTILLNATSSSGTEVRLVNESFTVQDFNPELSVSETPGHYFSFYGNSPNSSLGIEATTNVSCRFWLNATGPGGSDNFYNGNGTLLNFTINGSLGLFTENGRYEIGVAAMEKSGRAAGFSFNISVNNTIPALGIGNRTLYFNESLARIPIRFAGNTTYWYRSVGVFQNNTTLDSPFLKVENLSTNIVLSARTIWGNYNHTDLQLVYFNGRPEISLNVSRYQLIYSRTFTISYSIYDPVNLSRVNLTVGDVSEHLGDVPRGKVHFTVNRDGLYNISLEASDACGNANSSGIMEVSSHYFPDIKSVKP